MSKFENVSPRLSFSPKYCRAVTENAIKPLVIMYLEAMSIFLGSKYVLNLVYFWVFQKSTVSDPPPPVKYQYKFSPGLQSVTPLKFCKGF